MPIPDEVSIDDVCEFLGEGLHTAFRKAGDSAEANQIWHLINTMDGAEWRSILRFVAGPLLQFLAAQQRRAQ
jgi:hypothetical protein